MSSGGVAGGEPRRIDNHFHVLLVGSRPGYETRTIETAFAMGGTVAHGDPGALD